MKQFIVSLLAGCMLTSTLSFGIVCDNEIKALDKATMGESYKNIAYLAYRHRKKREYLAKSYELLAKIRENNSRLRASISETMLKISSSLLVESASVEGDSVTASNEVDLALMQSEMYKGIKKEISETFNAR